MEKRGIRDQMVIATKVRLAMSFGVRHLTCRIVLDTVQEDGCHGGHEDQLWWEQRQEHARLR